MGYARSDRLLLGLGLATTVCVWKETAGMVRSAMSPEDRICTHCDTGQVQDEMHVLTCSWHGALRHRYSINGGDAVAIKQDLIAAKPNVLWYLYHVLKAEDDYCRSISLSY